MANHASALKRARQNKVRRMRNMAYKTQMKNAIKDVRVAVSDKAVEQTGEKLTKAVSIIQKTAAKGVIHRNKASRQISRLSRLVNTAASS